MARKHGIIKVAVWEPGSEFRALKKDAQRVFLMLISQPTINNLGLLDYTPERWAQYAEDDTIRSINRALRALTEQHFVVVDARTRELLVRTFIRHDNIGDQPNLVRSAGKQLREVESHPLRMVLAANYPWLVGLSPSPCGVMLEPLPEPLWKPPPEGVSEGVRAREAHAPAAPSPTPTPSPEVKDERSIKAETALNQPRERHAPLPEDKQRAVLQLLDAIGDHAQDTDQNGHPPTITVLTSLAHQLPFGTLAKVHESLISKRPKPANRAGYAVAALQAERDALESRS